MRRSLKALQVDQLDLVQMHWWVVAGSLSVAGLSAVDHAREDAIGPVQLSKGLSMT